MAQVVISERADLDTNRIFLNLAAKAGRFVVVKYEARFELLFDNLAAYPDQGAPRPTLGKNIRIAVVDPFIVIYRHMLERDTVAVLRVVDGRRRITSGMLPRNPR
jgi:toxin ParE1/3/4